MPKNAHFVSENVCSGHFDNFHTCSAHCRIVLRLRHIPPWRLNFEETKEGMNKVTNFSKPPIKITVDFQIISPFEKILTCVKNLKKKKTIRTSNRTVRLVFFMFSASDLLLKPLNHEKNINLWHSNFQVRCFLRDIINSHEQTLDPREVRNL